MPTTDPTEYLCQYSADEDIWSHHPLQMYGGQKAVPCGCTYLLPWGRRLMVSSKTCKKTKFLCEQISRCTVARRIPGRFWKMGYHIYWPSHHEANTVCLTFLRRVIFYYFLDLLRCSMVRQLKVAIVTLRSDQQGESMRDHPFFMTTLCDHNSTRMIEESLY